MRDIKKFVESLIPAIMEIDGGCDGCIHQFIKDSKKAMDAVDLEFMPHWDDGEWKNLRLEVKEI